MRSMLISAIAAGSLLVSTTAAATQPSLPAAPRDGADVEDADQIASSFMLIGIIAVIAVIGIFVLLDDDDEDVPTSP